MALWLFEHTSDLDIKVMPNCEDEKTFAYPIPSPPSDSTQTERERDRDPFLICAKKGFQMREGRVFTRLGIYYKF